MATGKDLNQRFLKNIDKMRQDILDRGEQASTLSDNVIDVSGDRTSFVVPDEIDAFSAVNALKNYLEFSTFKPENTFEIYGAIVKEDGREIVTSLYIRKEDIGKVADNASAFERLLGIKLPAQIHQFESKYKNSTIPGTDSEFPRPKLMSESSNAYEIYLETFYAHLNIRKEETIDGIGRKPYPHEQIDFKNGDTINSLYQSEYFLKHFASERKKAIVAQRAAGSRQNTRINSGDRLTVRESEDVENTPLGRKIGSALNSFDTFFKNSTLWRKIRLGAIGCLASAGAIFLAVSNPGIAAAAIYGTGLVGGSLFIGKKVHKSLKKKVDNYLYGPPIVQSEQTPDHPTEPPRQGPVPTQEQQPPRQRQEDNPPAQAPEPEQDPFDPFEQQPKATIIPEVLDSYLAEAGINMSQYRDIENSILLVQSELAKLNPSSREYANKEQELHLLKKQQRDQLQVIEHLMSEMFKEFNMESKGRGGKY